jgi:hypothetical protein
MREITLKIPDKKISFFMELVNQLGLEIKNDIIIPEKHSQIVLERIEASKKNLIDC